MQLQSLWSGFTPQQYDYITNLIKNSDAKTVCELGTFVGTAAKNIWSEIKDTGKKLYLVDNYAFIPEDKREKFFKTVKDSIDKDTRNIIKHMMNEAILIGKKLNINIKLTVEKRIEGAKNVGDHKTSTLQDFENKRPLELNALIHALIELGQLTNTHTPTLNSIYRLAKFFSERRGIVSK